MTRIHPLIFLGIGIIVTIISSLKSELLFFRYIGIVLIIYGTARLLIEKITNKATKTEKGEDFGIQQIGKELKMQQNQYNYRRDPNIHTFGCNRCKATVTVSDNFCRTCGFRLR